MGTTPTPYLVMFALLAAGGVGYAAQAAPPVPAVTLAAGGPIYFGPVGFPACSLAASGGQPVNPFTLPGATFPGGQLNLAAPGVCARLRLWNGIGCGSLHTPWRQTCSEHGSTAWMWRCTGRVGGWVLGGSRGGQDTIKAAFVAAFGRPWLGGDSEERMASLASMGLVIPGCVLPGCPPPMPPRLDPDPCAAEPLPPVCGDGTCEPGEVCPEDCEPDPPECPPPDPCPDPVPVRALIEVDGCGPLGGRVVTDAGSIPFRPGIRSTGELVMELRERPPCPPLPVCPDPDPCDDPDDPEPPPPTGWELLHQAPAGWTWTAGSVPPAQILDIRVPSRGAYSAVRLTYQVAVDWSRCRELPGPSPSAKCLGVYLTREGRADQVLSYLMAVAEYRASGGRLTLEPSKLTHRHGWVPGWSPTQKPRAGAPVRLLDGETYTIEHEVVDGKVTVSVTGQAVAAVLRAPDTCTPAPCFPALFPAGALVLRAGWRGDEPDEVGGTMGWVLSGLRLEVRR